MIPISQSNLLERRGFTDEERCKKALEMLLIDRRNEFRELAEAIFGKAAGSITIPNWEEFILKTCLEVEEAFDTWSGKSPILPNSDLKALTILRQFGRGKTSMIHLTHLLNVSYTLGVEYKVIYKRIK